MPVKAYPGSDYPKIRDDLRQITDPFTGRRVFVVPPIRPDVCLLHAHAADRQGRVLMERCSDADLAARASEMVMVSVERVVDDLEAETGPEVKLLPSIYVSHIVEMPHGAAPTACPGAYDYDFEAARRYAAAVKEDRLVDWLASMGFGSGR